MSFFQNNELHRSGWHVLASSWQDHSMELPEHSEVNGRDWHAMVTWTDVPDNNNTATTNNNNAMTTTTTTTKTTTAAATTTTTTTTTTTRISIALIGGRVSGRTASVSVFYDIFNPRSQWQYGPDLNVPRFLMGACVCHGHVYVMGGMNHEYENLNTIERIPVSQLFRDDHCPNHNNVPSSSSSSWTRLSARLSVPRRGCTAVTVHDRFIVVMGGYHNFITLASVDIIDSMTPAATSTSITNNNNNINNNHLKNHEFHTTVVVTVSSGPRLQTPRRDFGATVLDNHIYVVGGLDGNNEPLDTVECLAYGMLRINFNDRININNINDDSIKNNNNNNNNSTQYVFSSAWSLQPDLSLCQARSRHCVVVPMMGQHLVVAGGWNGSFPLHSMELLLLDSPSQQQPQQQQQQQQQEQQQQQQQPHQCDGNGDGGSGNVLLELPGMLHQLYHFSMVVDIPPLFLPALVVIGRNCDNGKVRIESLPYINLSLTQLKNYSKPERKQQWMKTRHQPSWIPCSIGSCFLSRSEGRQEQGTALEAMRQQSQKVKSLCSSLVFYYMFHRGHIPIFVKQEQEQ